MVPMIIQLRLETINCRSIYNGRLFQSLITRLLKNHDLVLTLVYDLKTLKL